MEKFSNNSLNEEDGPCETFPAAEFKSTEHLSEESAPQI